MNVNLKILFEEDFRKQVQQQILDQAKAVARSLVDETVKTELQRLTMNLEERYRKNDHVMRSLMVDVVRNLLNKNYRDDLMLLVYDAVKTAADEVVAQKLLDKTVWEAKSQDAYIRNIVRQELKAVIDNVNK